MTDSEFDKFLDNCYEELKKKQALLFRDYNLGNYAEYWYDQTSGSIQFKNLGVVELEFIIVPIGSWSSNTNTWMWAWANQSIVEELRENSLQLKELASFTGFDIFKKETFEADESMAHELTSMAVHYLGAMGMYIVPANHIKAFQALIKIK